MGICPNCGSWVDEGDICMSCGGGNYSSNSETGSNRNVREDEEYYLRKAEEYSINGKHLEAIEFYKSAQSYLNNNFIMFDIAKEYETIGDYDTAMEYWDRLCAWNDVNVYIVLGKADLLYRLGRYEEAVTFYKKALNVPTNHSPVLRSNINIAISNSYNAMGKYDMGDSYRENSKKEINTFVYEKMKIADRHMFRGDLDSAKMFYNIVLENDPNNLLAKRKLKQCERICNMDPKMQEKLKKEASERKKLEEKRIEDQKRRAKREQERLKRKKRGW